MNLERILGGKRQMAVDCEDQIVWLITWIELFLDFLFLINQCKKLIESSSKVLKK